MLTLGQCWANVVLPTPTIGQPYYPIPTLAQHSHAIWDTTADSSHIFSIESVYKQGIGLMYLMVDLFAWASLICKEQKRLLQNENIWQTPGLELTTCGLCSHYHYR